MTSVCKALLIAFIFTVAGMVDAAEADPANKKKAEAVIKAANDLHKNGLYKEARQLYLKAYDIYPSSDAMWNIARTYELQKEFRLALEYFEKCLVVETNPALKKSTADKIAEMKALLPPLLSVEVTPKNAKILLDGKPLATGSIKDSEVTAGQHTLTVTAPGHHSKNELFAIDNAMVKRLTITLTPITGKVVFKCTDKDTITVKTAAGEAHEVDVPGELTLKVGEHELQVTKAKRYKTAAYKVTVSENPAEVALQPLSILKKKLDTKTTVTPDPSLIKKTGASNTLKWVLMGGGGALMAGGVTFIVLGYLKYQGVEGAETNQDGEITSLTMKQADDDLNSANTFTYIGLGVLTVGAAALTTSLFMKSSRSPNNHISLLPVKGGAIGVITSTF